MNNKYLKMIKNKTGLQKNLFNFNALPNSISSQQKNVNLLPYFVQSTDQSIKISVENANYNTLLNKLNTNNPNNTNPITVNQSQASLTDNLNLQLRAFIAYGKLVTAFNSDPIAQQKSLNNKIMQVTNNQSLSLVEESLTSTLTLKNTASISNGNKHLINAAISEKGSQIVKFIENLTEQADPLKINIINQTNVQYQAQLVSQNSVNKRISNYLEFISNFNSKVAKAETINNNFSFVSSWRLTNKITQIESLIRSLFLSMSIIISKPTFEIINSSSTTKAPKIKGQDEKYLPYGLEGGKVILRLFYYMLEKNTDNTNTIGANTENAFSKNRFIKNRKFKLESDKTLNAGYKSNNIMLSATTAIVKILTSFFKKPVELELVRLHSPTLDSAILVNLIAIYANKIKLRFIQRELFKKNSLTASSSLNNSNKLSNTASSLDSSNLSPSFVSGISIKVAGRLLTQRVIPRKTVKVASKGTFARSKVILTDTTRFTNKNTRGSYSITLTLSNMSSNRTV